MVKCKIIPHPGDPGIPYQRISGATLTRYAKELNRAKITFTCSSKHKYRLGKYVEIPMCGSLLAADLPNEGHNFFKQFMLVLDPADSDQNIINKVIYYVNNNKERNKLIQKGIELNKEYTQEKYAERFIQIAEEFLNDFRNNASI